MQRFLLLTALTLLIPALAAIGQAPRTISYQGIVVNAGGNPVPDGSHQVTLVLYDGANAVYSETHTVTTLRGLFNVTIGSVIPIPLVVAFDRPYQIGVSVDGGSELSPRTTMTAVPYAFRAMVADAVAPGATGVVTSVNGLNGAVTVVGGGGTTVTQNGGQLVISSSGGGGTGIAGVQSPDGSINITDPNGPVAGLSLANGAVTPAKISSDGASNGNVLTFNGSNVVWAAPASGLTIPFSATTASSLNSFALTSSGTGSVGWFRNTHTLATSSAVYGESNISSSSTTVAGVEGKSTNAFGVIGRGGASSVGVWGTVITGATAGSFYAGTGTGGFSDNGYGVAGVTYSNTHAGVYGTANGTGIGVRGTSTNGKAAFFEITSNTNTSIALEATTNGSGHGILGSNTATTGSTTGVRGEASSTSHGVGATGGVSGVVGAVTPTTPGGYSAGVRGLNSGTGGTGIGVIGYQAGSGWGVYGETPSGFGVYGLTTNNSAASVGVRGETFSTNGIAVEAKYSGTGVGTALELDNGAIRVSGVNKAAFIHTATPANKLSANGTDIDNPMCNGDATCILIVTQKLNPSGIVYNNSPIGVYYNSVRNKWEIFNENNVAIPNNAQFNVLVIKQ